MLPSMLDGSAGWYLHSSSSYGWIALWHYCSSFVCTMEKKPKTVIYQPFYVAFCVSFLVNVILFQLNLLLGLLSNSMAYFFIQKGLYTSVVDTPFLTAGRGGNNEMILLIMMT